MPIPVLKAIFVPQSDGEPVVPVGPSQEVDIGLALLALPAARFRRVLADIHRGYGADLEDLAYALGLAGSGAHEGPFELRVEPEVLTDFLFSAGLRDIGSVDDAVLAEVRSGLAGPSLPAWRP
jgi:hypothetical protein